MRSIRLLMVGALATSLTGCAALYEGYEGRHHEASSSLVGFLYGSKDVPPVDATVQLQLPIRVGVSFLPTNGSAAPSSVDREKVLAAIRENFKSLPYVSEIVPIPDYYLQTGQGRGGEGSGFTQIEQLSRLHRLDLFALVSYDQITDSSMNKSSLAYWTIVGAYFVRGDRHETHTLLDLAVVDPNTRSLVLRSGGTSSLGGNTTLVEAEHHETAQRSRGFELATASLVDNFKRELVDFEARVKAGTAPVKVTRRSSGGGGGAIDPALLILLAVFSLRGVLGLRGRRSLASVRS